MSETTSHDVIAQALETLEEASHAGCPSCSARWEMVGGSVEWMEDPTKIRKLPVLKLFLTATITLLAALATLTACSDTTPAPETLTSDLHTNADGSPGTHGIAC